jgi:predicted phage terminase large subunit-like protein
MVALQRIVHKQSLTEFIKDAWHVLEGGTPYIHNWHVDALSDHLQACAYGDINRLLINIPPGCMKSQSTGVFFPAWLWGPAGWPECRFIGASHEATLATRDSRSMRKLVRSEWYQERYPLRMAQDQDDKTLFENVKNGWRAAAAVRAMTGRRGDGVLWDDPLSPEKAYSDLDRNTANRIFSETLPTRLVDPSNSFIIIIMQRLHQQDVSGYIMEKDFGYTHLMLPMEFEPDRKCYTVIGFEDPRTQEGELLFEGRFPRDVVDRDKYILGAFATAGQLQQRPSPRGGSMFLVDEIETVESLPASDDWKYCRGWDLAATPEDGDWTVGFLLAHSKKLRKTAIVHVVRKQKGSVKVRNLMKTTAEADVDYRDPRTQIVFQRDPGQAGKDQAQSIITEMSEYPIRAISASGSKEDQAEPFAAQVEAGNVIMVEGPWNDILRDEMANFPASTHDDQIDAGSTAYNHLMKRARRGGGKMNAQGSEREEKFGTRR